MENCSHECGMSGATYGKKQKTGGRSDSRSGTKNKKGMMAYYDNLYKSQYMVMEKLFKREN